MTSSKDIIKDKLIQQDYYGFTKQEFDRADIGHCIRGYYDGKFKYIQEYPTDGKILAMSDETEDGMPYSNKFLYCEDGISPKNGAPMYHEATPYKNGYALVKVNEDSRGYQFRNIDGKLSRYLTKEEINSIDPTSLGYYNDDFEMYLNGEFKLEDLELYCFLDDERYNGLSKHRRIFVKEISNFDKAISKCKDSQERYNLRVEFEDRMMWVNAVVEMVNNPEKHRARLIRKKYGSSVKI